MPEDQDCLPALSFCHTVLPYVHHYDTDAHKFLKLPFCLSLRETEERTPGWGVVIGVGLRLS